MKPKIIEKYRNEEERVKRIKEIRRLRKIQSQNFKQNFIRYLSIDPKKSVKNHDEDFLDMLGEYVTIDQIIRKNPNNENSIHNTYDLIDTVKSKRGYVE